MPQPFEYYRPKTRLEALELLVRQDIHAVPLIVHPKPSDPRRMGVGAFIDLGLLGLDTIRSSPDGCIHIGALATLQQVVDFPLLQEEQRLILARAAALVAGPGIRNLACLWGAIQARSGPPEVILALLALEAQVVLLGGGGSQRILRFQEYYNDLPGPLRKDELVLEAILPPAGACGWALVRIARTPRDEAIVAAAALVEIQDGKVTRLSLALAGAHPMPVRLFGVEESLTGKALTPDALEGAAEAVIDQADPIGDFRGSAEYRRAMAGLVARRALQQAWAAAEGRQGGAR